MILRISRNRNVGFIIAPYVAWPQLIHIQRHSKAYIHAIFGPTNTLLYPGVDRLITSLELVSASPNFTFTSKRTFISELGVSKDRFLDIGILEGVVIAHARAACNWQDNHISALTPISFAAIINKPKSASTIRTVNFKAKTNTSISTSRTPEDEPRFDRFGSGTQQLANIDV
ncbi:hypothetical protein F5877DRAFT_80339 [Lentinula edodes]|nr:hypothetical protein F5877DRAFT_80339 [Lentinula edodes]